jgi:hypothetical protein
MRLFPHAESVSLQETLTRDLHTIVDVSFVFDHLLVSLGNVSDQKPVIAFIDKIIYPPSTLAAVDPIAQRYISLRVKGMAHLTAIESCRVTTPNRAKLLKRS